MIVYMVMMVISRLFVLNIFCIILVLFDVYIVSKNFFLVSNNLSFICMFCIIASGVILLNVFINFVVLSINMMEDMNKLVIIILLIFNGDFFNVIVVIVFIGCTGMGISYRNVVSTLYNFVNMIVVFVFMLYLIDILMSSGKKVLRFLSVLFVFC